MGSLTDLNNTSAQNINYTDLRNPKVKYEQFDELDKDFTETSVTFTIINSVEVLEVIRPNQTNFRYTINLATSTATLDFGTIPSGVTVSKTGSLYTVRGIDSVDDWDSMKNPTCTVPNDFQGDFSYTTKIIYNTLEQNDVEVVLTVGVFIPVSLMSSAFTQAISAGAIKPFDPKTLSTVGVFSAIPDEKFLYNSTPTGSAIEYTSAHDFRTGDDNLVAVDNTPSGGETYTITVSGERYDNLFSSVTSPWTLSNGQFTYSNTSLTDINTKLGDLNWYFADGIQHDTNLVFELSIDGNPTVYAITLPFTNTTTGKWLKATGGITYTTNTQYQTGNGPELDSTWDDTDVTVKVYPTDASAISTITGTPRPTQTSDFTFTPGIEEPDFDESPKWFNFTQDGTRMVIFSEDDNDNLVYLKASNGQYYLEDTLDGASVSGLPYINSAGDRIVVVQDNDLTVWNRSLSTWTKDYEVNLGSINADEVRYANDGDTVYIGDYTYVSSSSQNYKIERWDNNGSTYVKSDDITIPNSDLEASSPGGGFNRLQYLNISCSDDGSKLVFRGGNDIIQYTYSSVGGLTTTNTISATGSSYTHVDRVEISADGNYLVAICSHISYQSVQAQLYTWNGTEQDTVTLAGAADVNVYQLDWNTNSDYVMFFGNIYTIENNTFNKIQDSAYPTAYNTFMRTGVDFLYANDDLSTFVEFNSSNNTFTFYKERIYTNSYTNGEYVITGKGDEASYLANDLTVTPAINYSGDYDLVFEFTYSNDTYYRNQNVENNG